MKGIVYNNLNDAEALIVEVDAAFNFAFQGDTTTYTHWIKHPDRDEWAVVFDMIDINNMTTSFPELMAGLSKGVNDVVDLDSSWIEVIVL